MRSLSERSAESVCLRCSGRWCKSLRHANLGNRAVPQGPWGYEAAYHGLSPDWNASSSQAPVQYVR